MIKITEQDLDNLQFDGIIVGVPIIENIKEGQHDDISFIVECNYYTNGKHGYPEPGNGCNNSSFYHVCYNTDSLENGLWMNATSRFTIDHIFRFDSYNYYKFENMTEFCKWYLNREGYKCERPETKVTKNTYVKVDKEWIQEKCGTNTPPTTVPEHPSKGNKKKLFSETEEQKIAKITETCLKDLIRDELKEQVQKDKLKELNKINGENVYWDIYCEKDTTPEMREKIEEIYPYFKEQYAKSIKQYDGEKLKDIYTQDEIREKLNPGWKTRRQKYGELITLMDLYWKWIKESVKPDATLYTVKHAHDKLEEFLDGEANDYFG